MSVKFAAWGNHQFVIPTTGAPASGYKLNTYVAGSSTLVTTYTTSAGSVAQSNPIILNSAGFPTTGQIWITEGTSIKIDFTDASDVSIKIEDNIPGTNDATLTQDQWITGPAPTYVSATSFTLVGDQTSDFHVGRRVKTTNTAGTIYSRISATAYTTLTTVTIVNDSGTLDLGLSAVSYGLLTATSFSIPRLTETNKRILDLPGLADANTWTGLQTMSGTVTMSGKSVIEANASIAAHATTMDPWSLGNYVTATGPAVTFTNMAAAPQAGAEVEIYMNAAHIFTDGAVFEVDGDANWTAEAGDRVLLRAKSTILFTVHPRKKTGSAITTPVSVQAEVATTSGTAVTIAASVPAWVKSFAVGVHDLSTSGTSAVIIQLGDSGGYEITGYQGTSGADGASSQLSSGFMIMPAAYITAADTLSGMFIFNREDSATQKWSCSGGSGRASGVAAGFTFGYKSLSDVLTQIRITTAGGADTFDAGAASVTYLG